VLQRLANLTRRTREVMELLIAGETSKEIAMAMDVSVRTVEGHRRIVFSKDARLLGRAAGPHRRERAGKPLRTRRTTRVVPSLRRSRPSPRSSPMTLESILYPSGVSIA